ncbi:MAG: hypothetical protein ACLFR0_02830 [Alphaproteobacteria bacterium]
MRIFLLITLFGFYSICASQAFAQEAQDSAAEESQSEKTLNNDDDFKKRLELARELHTIKPVKEQVDNAVESVAQRLPQAQREDFKMNMRNVLNYNSIRNISVNAMAETFTLEELEAMLEYNRKPEAQSANEKFPEYQEKVSPEIIRMIDKAIIKVRTGGE